MVRMRHGPHEYPAHDRGVSFDAGPSFDAVPGEGPFRFQMRGAVEKNFTPNAWDTISRHPTLAEATAQATKHNMDWQEWRVSCCPYDVEAWLQSHPTNHNLSHAPETASLVSKDARRRERT